MAVGIVTIPAAAAPVAAASTAATQPPTSASPATSAPSAARPVRSGQAYPSRGDVAAYKKALAWAKAHGRLQKQGRHLVAGEMVSAGSAASGYALPAGAPPVGCSTLAVGADNYGVTGAWPNVNYAGTPCYIDGFQYDYSVTPPRLIYRPTAPQTVFPGQNIVLGETAGPNAQGITPGPVASAWMIGWDNLFDYWPLMRSATGLAANEISGYDDVWIDGIPPSLDDSGCYTPALFYNSGRFQTQCTVADSYGPYYGTPAGQAVPWMVAAGSLDDLHSSGNSGGAPVVFNCFTECPGPPQWQGIEIESAVNIEPSPYAGFSWVGSGLFSAAFTDTSLSDLQITSWAWDFGDGTSSSEQSPTHTYAEGGQYTVKLSITSADGQVSTSSTTVTVPGTLTVTAKLGTSNGTQTLPVGKSLALTATVTNPDEQGVSGVALDDPVLPADNALTWSGSWSCQSGCVDPLPPGASEQFGSTVTGATVNTKTDTVSVTASGTEDGVTVNGGPATSNGVRTLEAVTVTGLVPGHGQDDGNDPVNVVGTGFQSASGNALVTSVGFEPVGGSSTLAATNVVVTSDTTLTLNTPSVASLLQSNPTGSLQADVVVNTATQTSPLSPADLFTYACKAQSSLPVGTYVASGCFNQPDQNDDTLAGQGTLDGAQLTPSSNSALVDFSTLNSTVGVSSGSAAVGINLGRFGIVNLCNLPASASLTSGASWACTVNSGATIGGWPLFGSVTFKATGSGTMSGSVTTQLPAVLGGKTAVLTFTSSASAGTTVTVAAPDGGDLGQLWGLTFTSISFNSSKGTWTINGKAITSAGKSTTFKGTLSYSGTALVGGSLDVGEIDVGGVITFSKIALSYASGSWTASATLTQAKQTAAVSLTFNAAGQLTAGSITTGKILLFGCLPLDSLSLTYKSGAWALATTASISGGGKLAASLAVVNGAVTGGSITLSGGSIPLFSQLSLTSLALSYSATAKTTTYAATIGVQLPGTVVSGVEGSFTITNDKFTKGSLKVTGNVPLFSGLVLHSLEASFTTPPNPTGTSGLEVCGGVGVTAGPTVGGESLAELDGAIDYTFPSATGASVYRAVGELKVPLLISDKGVLGTAALKYVSGSGLATFSLALGKGSASAHCPLPALGTSAGLKFPGGLEISGNINGDISATDFFVNGSANIVAPKIPGMSGGVSGTVAIDTVDVTACAAIAGHSGRYGFTYDWDGTYTPYLGDCALPASPFAKTQSPMHGPFRVS